MATKGHGINAMKATTFVASTKKRAHAQYIAIRNACHVMLSHVTGQTVKVVIGLNAMNGTIYAAIIEENKSVHAINVDVVVLLIVLIPTAVMVFGTNVTMSTISVPLIRIKRHALQMHMVTKHAMPVKI